MSTSIPNIPGKTIIARHPAHKYAEQVISGEINACRRVKQACSRYMHDLETMHERGMHFDHKEAAYAIDWFRKFLNHAEGKYVGTPFELLPWQQFIIWNLHGFMKGNVRRFKYSYVQIPKKNGKTTMLAGHSLYLMLADREASPEIYYSATTRDQAKIAFRAADKMRLKSPRIRELLESTVNSIYCPANFGFAKPLSSDANTTEGINVFVAIVDEYHVHKTDEMYNGMKAGMIARHQPLHLTITTAGFDTTTPCYDLYESCCDLLDGKIEDDTRFCVIYEIDTDDDWEDPATWAKANPSMGHSVTMDRMEEEFNQAKNQGGTQVINFKTKHLNVWCNAQSEWIPDALVTKCMVDKHEWPSAILKTTPSYAGLDLASTSDITAFSRLYVIGPDEFYLRNDYWLPESILEKYRYSNSSHPYVQWVEKGYIHVTPGNVTDYDYIRAFISGSQLQDDRFVNTGEGVMSNENLKAIAYDRFNSSQLIVNLTADGANLFMHGQGYVSLSYPTKELERLISGGKLKILHDPVFRWMMGNVALESDPAGNIKPNKAKSKNKIDGVVSAVMAIGCYRGNQNEIENMPADQFTVIKI